MSLGTWLLLAVTGALGAPLRYLLDRAISRRWAGRLPWGTLVVNLSGALLLGLITGAGLYHALPTTPRLLLGTGLCGAYTTFSTFAFETVSLARGRRSLAAAANLLVSTVGGCAMAALGLVLAAQL